MLHLAIDDGLEHLCVYSWRRDRVCTAIYLLYGVIVIMYCPLAYQYSVSSLHDDDTVYAMRTVCLLYDALCVVIVMYISRHVACATATQQEHYEDG